MEMYLIACSCPEWLNAKASYTTPCCNDFVTVGLFCRGRWRTTIFIYRVMWCSRIFTSNSISLLIDSAGFHILLAVHTHTSLRPLLIELSLHEASKHNTHTYIHKHTGGWQLISAFCISFHFLQFKLDLLSLSTVSLHTFFGLAEAHQMSWQRIIISNESASGETRHHDARVIARSLLCGW